MKNDRHANVTLLAIPFEGGFTAKWNANNSHVDLVNLEWICNNKGTTPQVYIYIIYNYIYAI